MLSLLLWLLDIILHSIEHHVVSTAADKALGLPVPSIDGAFSYVSLVDRASDCIEKFTSSTTVTALMHIAAMDNTGSGGFLAFFHCLSALMHIVAINNTGSGGFFWHFFYCLSALIRIEAMDNTGCGGFMAFFYRLSTYQ